MDKARPGFAASHCLSRSRILLGSEPARSVLGWCNQSTVKSAAGSGVREFGDSELVDAHRSWRRPERVPCRARVRDGSGHPGGHLGGTADVVANVRVGYAAVVDRGARRCSSARSAGRRLRWRQQTLFWLLLRRSIFEGCGCSGCWGCWDCWRGRELCTHHRREARANSVSRRLKNSGCALQSKFAAPLKRDVR